MSDDGLSKTMIIPNPGGRRTSAPNEVPPTPPNGQQPPPPQQQPQSSMPPIGQNSDFGDTEGENILLVACNDIITLAGNIKSLEPSHSIEQLRQDIDRLISQFTNQLTNSNVNKEIVLTARYIICCLLDELVLSTPWGTESSWSQQTLLGKYHNETWGGEKFFLIVNKLLEQPQRNINLIELCYVCLSVGFAGKYRVSQQGQAELLQISQILYQHIEQQKPVERDLSPAWQGVGVGQKSLVKRFPSWVVLLVMAFVLLGVYIGLLSNLKAQVDPIYQKLESVGWQDFVLKMNESKPLQVDIDQVIATLKSDLSDEINNQQITIDQKEGMALIRFVSTSLFNSGSSRVNQNSLPDVNRLVNAIHKHADRVLVIGHTDSTGKADSNWVISRKRAEAIAAWLNQADVQLSNTITRGVADTQPLFDNDSDYHRSLNRRVELILVLKD